MLIHILSSQGNTYILTVRYNASHDSSTEARLNETNRLTQLPQSHIVRNSSSPASGADTEVKYEKSQAQIFLLIRLSKSHFLVLNVNAVRCEPFYSPATYSLIHFSDSILIL